MRFEKFSTCYPSIDSMTSIISSFRSALLFFYAVCLCPLQNFGHCHDFEPLEVGPKQLCFERVKQIKHIAEIPGNAFSNAMKFMFSIQDSCTAKEELTLQCWTNLEANI